MLDELKKQFTSVQILITLLIVAVGIYVLSIVWQFLGNFSDILVILLSAWLLSFILEPIVYNLSRITKMYKVASALVVYMLFLGLVSATVFLFIPIVTTQLQNLFLILPKYLSSYPEFINKWGDLMTTSITNSLTFLPSVATFLFDMFIVLIISFYFVLDKERINRELFNLIPKKWQKEANYIQSVIDTTFASFIRVQLLFGIMSGIATWLVLRLFNVDFAASTALISGILTIVPLIGPVLAVIPPVAVAFVMDTTKGLLVLGSLVILQQVIFNVIGPKLMGKAFKMHPVVVLLSFLVGFKIAGSAGAIFAVPVLGILLVVIHRLSRHFINRDEK